ncbi:Uncharacterised protein [Burkholderia pseudomallei]|nr:Uncharacterised protein [Burkholderia pseudomallei]CAJ6715097.1 Uncharacterised protein [Burkholderia pseudomallei]
MLGLLGEIWRESSRREKQNLVFALLAIVVAITGGLSWLLWHKAWIAVGLVVLANVIAIPLFEELEELDRYR